MSARKIFGFNIFYGYWVLLVAFFCMFISLGLGSYSFSLFVKPVESDLGWSRGAMMVGVTIFHLSMAVASPFVGRIVDMKGVRGIVVAGAAIGGLGFLLLSSMQSIYIFYLSYVIIGIGMTAIGQVPSATAVSNWFHKRRGLAIGVMFAGMGAGGLILVPLIGGYLIPNLGWRPSYLVLACITWLLLIPLSLLLLRTRPSDVGLFPDGGTSTSDSKKRLTARQPQHDFTTKTALAKVAFWLLAASYFIIGFSQSGFFFNLVPHLQEAGLSALVAATAFSFVGVGSAVGKVGFGWLCDYIHPRYVFCLSMGLQIISILLFTLTVTEVTPVYLLALYGLLFGFGLSGIMPALPLLVSKYFGLRSYGALFGILSFGFNVGCGVGPLLAGFSHDAIGTYYPSFLIFVLMIVFALIAMLTLGPLAQKRLQKIVP